LFIISDVILYQTLLLCTKTTVYIDNTVFLLHFSFIFIAVSARPLTQSLPTQPSTECINRSFKNWIFRVIYNRQLVRKWRGFLSSTKHILVTNKIF